MAWVLAAAIVAAAALAAWKHEKVQEKILWLRYWQTLETPRLPAPRYAAQARLEDLEHLARLPEVDRSFTAATRAEFLRRVAALRTRVADLDEAGFILGAAHAAAAAGNGHTQLDGATWRSRLPSVPVRFAWFGEALHIVRAHKEHEGLLGARVVAIGGVPPSQWLADLRPYLSGTAERARALSPLLLESPAVLAELRPALSPAEMALSIADAADVAREVRLPAVAPAHSPATTKPGRVLAADGIEGERDEWRFLPAAREIRSLRGAESLFHAERIAEGVLYLHPWRVSRGFDASVGRALDLALGDDAEPAFRRIVLDLRFNDGGEYPMVYHALRRLPRRLASDGRLEILTDETTYSGAIIAAALAKHFTGARTRIRGAPAGDALAFWAEGTHVEMPHSRLRVHISTGYHDWAHGCRAWHCYWPNVFRGVAAGSIAPDIAGHWRFEDYVRGVDTVLEAALQ